MRNINAVRTKFARTEQRARGELIEEVLGLMSIMRTSAERSRVRRLIRKSISLTHLHVLTVLKAEGPMPVGELAKELDVSVASATGIVSRMLERGLVGRQRSETDRRVVTVSLAPGGQTALDQLEGRGRDHFVNLLERLSSDELTVVRDAFEAMQRAQQELTDEGIDLEGSAA